jgi:predicted NBD/HSP70 family sugar kinase
VQRAEGAETSPGSQRALRAANESRLLELLEVGSPSSQAALVRASGLSPSTVSVTVRRLVETGRVHVESGTSNGRRSVLVRAVSSGQLCAGVDIGRTHLRVTLGHGPREVIAEREVALLPGHAPRETVERIATVLAAMCAETDLAVDRVASMAVGLPGPVDRERGLVTGGSILPAWVDVPVDALLHELLPMPIALENDANLGALAVAATERPTSGNLLYVKVGSGVGAGLICAGGLLRGTSGLSGEIGHLPTSRGGQLCRCGRRGCLETVASVDSIRLGLSAILDQEISNREVVDLTLNGSEVARRVVEEAGDALGQALAAVSIILDPGLIVLGGPLEELGELLLRPVRQGFDRHALSATAKQTEIRLSSLGQRSEALGALIMALAADRAARSASLP